MKDNAKIEANGDGDSGDTLEVLVSFPEKRIKKLFSFDVHDKVWTAKLQVINELLKGVKDALNFGFYDPPCNGKSGKFLEEERTFVDYPLLGTPPVLEFQHKRRIFRSLVFEPKTLLKINSKPNQRKLLDLVSSDAVSQVAKMTEKGQDPNFQDERTGETPLTVAVSKENGADMIMTLVNFGALLDYRTRDGLTPLHKAAIAGRAHSVKILLDLGASPNYKDSKGLTPLFYTALFGGDPYCCEILLNDHAELHISDHQGMQEIHMACKNGLVQHLEHLLIYGAEIDARTASGNTALHVAALSNQDECARVLLFRGAKRNILNYANQSAYEVAAVGGNKELAELIQNFTDKGIVKLSTKPTYSTRRRKSVSKPKASSLFPRTSSEPQLSVKSDSSPPSPMSSTHSLRSTNSETTSVDEQSHSMNGDASEIHKLEENKLKRTLSGSSANSDSSYCSESDSGELSPKESRPRQERMSRQVSAPDVREKFAVPPVKVVSGAATIRKRLYASVPGKRFVAIRDYKPSVAGELALEKGDEVEVLYVGEKGYWEGRVGKVTGWFHHSCVEEKKRKGKVRPKTLFGRPVSASALVGKSDAQDFNHVGSPADPPMPTSRVLSLKRTNAGFGFQMRGANSQVPRLNFVPTADCPALQYIGEVDKGGEAHLKGVKHGDFILEVNGEDVTTATHGHVVELIKASGDTVTLKIVTTKNQLSNGTDQPDGKGSKLPPPPPERDLSNTQTLGRMNRLSTSRPALYEMSTGDNYEEPANYRVDSVITVSKENRWHSLQRQKPHARKPVGVQMKGQTSVKRHSSNSSNSGKAAGKRSMSMQNVMPPPYESLVGKRPLSGVVPVAIPQIPEESRLTRAVSEDNTGSLLRRTPTSKSTPNLEQSCVVSCENGHHSPRDEAERDASYNRPFSYVAPNDFKTRAASSDGVETIVAMPVKATVVAVENREPKAEQTCTVVATPVENHETTPRVQRRISETAVITRRAEGTSPTKKEKPTVPPKPVSLSDALQEAVAARAARLNRESSESTSPTKLSDPWDRRISAPAKFPTRKKVEPAANSRAESAAHLEQNFATGKGNCKSSQKPSYDSARREQDYSQRETFSVSHKIVNRNNTEIDLSDIRTISAPAPSVNQESGTSGDEFVSASSADIYRRYTSPTSPTKETSRQFSFDSLESGPDSSINSGIIKRQFCLDSTQRTDSKLTNFDAKQSPHGIANSRNAPVPVSPKPPVAERDANVKSKPTVPPPPVPKVKPKDIRATPVIEGLITAEALSLKKGKLKSSKKADGALTEKTGVTDANESVRKMSPADSQGFSSHHSILLAKAVAERAARSSLQSRSENLSTGSPVEEKALKPETIPHENNVKKSAALDVRVNSRGQPSPPVAPKKRLSSPVVRQAQHNRVGDGAADYGTNSLSPTKRAIYGSRSPGERSFPFQIPPPVLSEEDKTMMLLDEVLQREAESENWSLNSWTSSDSSSDVFVPPPVWNSEQGESDQRVSKARYECSSPSEESFPQASPTERLTKTVTTKKKLQITLTFEPQNDCAKEQARTSPLANGDDIHSIEPLKPTINDFEKTNSPEKSFSSQDGVKETDIDSGIPHPVVGVPNADNSFTPPPPPLLFTDFDESCEPLDSLPLPPPPEFCLTDLEEDGGSHEDPPTAACPPESVDHGKEETIPFTDISSIFGFSRPGRDALEKAVLDWDCDDVCNWLDSIQMSQYKEVFKENDIRGCHLPDLSKAELRELGVKSLGHRMTLENAIARLSQPLESNC